MIYDTPEEHLLESMRKSFENSVVSLVQDYQRRIKTMGIDYLYYKDMFFVDTLDDISTNVMNRRLLEKSNRGQYVQYVCDQSC